MPIDLSSFRDQLNSLQRQYEQLAKITPTSQLGLSSLPVEPPSIPRQVQYVEGMAGARIYQQNMQPNSSEIILDRNEDIFYFVSKDANGTPAKKIPCGHFTLEEPKEEEEPILLTKKDLLDFKEDIMQLVKQQNTTPAQAQVQTTKGGKA